MYSRFFGIALLGLLLAACQGPRVSGAPATPVDLKIGDPAPNFTLPDQDRQNVTLADFRGRTVQLAFYVWAMSPG
jgi:cytochrome oxidase Cu insertion factor (SCO1/SenC/PrrC family)